jgi:arginyl-tRNA synthetase
MEEISEALKSAAKDLFGVNIEPALSRPDEQFGDYATNIALQIGAQIKKNPREVAIALASKLHGQPGIAEAGVAGPGFINLKLTDQTLAKAAQTASQLPATLKGQEILVEFGDPNPFKEMHIGHLYSYIVGDSIARLLEAAGATVRRLSYHGDIGLHVAKAIWGMQQASLASNDADNRPVGEYYAAGAQAFEDDKPAAEEIQRINELVYAKSDPHINKLYDWGRQRSFKYFDEILEQIGVANDKRYLESQSADAGMAIVRGHTKDVFEESQGAVIYKGEKAGLHTRVFITSKGLPTYETKDLGLAELKNKDYPQAIRSIIITAHEQSEYFKVMLAALAEINKSLAQKTTHLPHGFVSLSSGKMSSRTGDVYSAEKLLAEVASTAKKLYPESNQATSLGAVKYGFLKHRLGSDLVYDIAESVSLEGNSGPYLQYAHARARSILQKAGQPASQLDNLEAGERSLARMISQYPEIVAQSTADLMPHHIANYLYELAKAFNAFYEKNRVVGDPRQAMRAALVSAYADVLKNGLSLLNITAPERV